MIAGILVVAASLYLVGLRADRIHAGRVTEPDQGRGESHTAAIARTVAVSSGSVTLYRGHDAAYWAGRFRHRTRQLQQVRTKLHYRWQPTVDYAYRLASAVTGVSYWQLRSVGECESHHNPFATNGRYKGVMQLGWSPFGFSPFDPIANVLSAAMTVRHDGSWRQWQCRP